MRALGNGWVDTGDDPDRIEAGTILWAAGVAASPLGRTLGVPVDEAGRVLVESDLSVPGHPEVFVVGDLAAFLHQTGAPLPGVAPVAIQQARHAADTIRRALAGQPSRPFRYRSLGNLAKRSVAGRRSPTSGGLRCRVPSPGWPGCSCTSGTLSGSATRLSS